MSKHTANSLGRLSVLQELKVTDCAELDAASLLGLRSLESLHMQCVAFSSVAALPTVLARQGQLTRLYLKSDYELTMEPPDQEDGDAANPWQRELAAQLTTSTNLHHLNLDLCIPSATWQHIFPEDRLLPQMRYLMLPHAFDDFGEERVLSADNVNTLARCCPALEALDCDAYDNQLPFQPALSSLAHLTSLHATVPGDASAVQVVTTLTALQRLHLQNLRWSTAEGSAALAALLQCSRLESLTCSSYHQRVHASAVSTLAQLTTLVELNLTRAAMPESQLLLLVPLMRLSRLGFSRHGLSAAFAEQAAQSFGCRTKLGHAFHEIKVGVWVVGAVNVAASQSETRCMRDLCHVLTALLHDQHSSWCLCCNVL